VNDDQRASRSAQGFEEVTHRGVRWQRNGAGRIRFYNGDGERWVAWGPGVDAPPLPPGWGVRDRPRPAGPSRAGWRSRWRLVPLVLTAVIVAIAVAQGLRPSGNQAHKEATETAALLGKCLTQNGTAGGHPRYSAKAVPCDAPTASVRVVRVIPSTPGGGICPGGTTGVEVPYPGVSYPHILCIQGLPPRG
jgi:hypothetical protein